MRSLEELEAHSTRATERWYEQATVRWPGMNDFSQVITASTASNQFFSHEALPNEVASALADATSEQAVRFELLQLYRHLKFTTLLEHKLILPTLQDIAFENLGYRLSKQMQLQALRLVTDEAFHGQRSEELVASLEKRTGVACRFTVSENEYLKSICETTDTAAGRLRRFLFCFVSETVISSIIAKNSKGITDSAVEGFFREHLRDETTHGVYFRAAFSVVWSQMDAPTRTALAPTIASDIHRFLAPEWGGMIEDLKSVGLMDQAWAIEAANPVCEMAWDCARVTLAAIADVDDDRTIRSQIF